MWLKLGVYLILNGGCGCEENIHRRKQFKILLAWGYKSRKSRGDDLFLAKSASLGVMREATKVNKKGRHLK